MPVIGVNLPWRAPRVRTRYGLNSRRSSTKWLRRCEYFTEDASRAGEADRVVQRVQLHPVGRLWAPIFPRFGRGQHTGPGAQWEGKREESAPTSDEDDPPSVVVAKVDIEGKDIVLRVAPEWELRKRTPRRGVISRQWRRLGQAEVGNLLNTEETGKSKRAEGLWE
jgi:hypothetical protein